MYKITFTDRTVILTSTEQGDKLKEAQLQSKPPVYFEIDKNQYRLDKIAKVEYQADEPINKYLPEPPRCHGQHSIHMVIYEAYRKKIGKGEKADWKEFRQKTYDWLYEKYPNREWCDNRKGTCFCESKAVQRIKEVIPGAEVIA